MEITISSITEIGAVNFAPATEIEEIIQNVRTIVTTPIYSVPLDRMFGVYPELVDLPIPVLQAKLTAKIVAAVQKYEPRAQVTAVTYDGDAKEGIVKPTVRIRIKE